MRVNADALRFVSLMSGELSAWLRKAKKWDKCSAEFYEDSVLLRLPCCSLRYPKVHRFGGGQSSPGRRGVGDINAFNYTWGGIEISLPRGCQLGHRIKGSGKRISYQAAAVQGGGLCAVKPQFCNWRIDFSYADTDGRTYKTSRGKTHNVCERYPESRLLSRRCLTTVRRVRRSM